MTVSETLSGLLQDPSLSPMTKPPQAPLWNLTHEPQIPGLQG